ncbi:MAG: hypothetical protein AAFY71_12080 [Bacteroidota bacterium]
MKQLMLFPLLITLAFNSLLFGQIQEDSLFRGQDSIDLPLLPENVKLYQVENQEIKRIALVCPGNLDISMMESEMISRMVAKGTQVYLLQSGDRVVADQNNSSRVRFAVEAETISSVLEVVRMEYKIQPISIIGFYQDVSSVFDVLVQSEEIQQAIVVEGFPQIKPAFLARIQCDVYGYYSGQNKNVMQRLSYLKRYMQANRKTFKTYIFEEADFGFMNQGSPLDTNFPEDSPRRELIDLLVGHLSDF